MLIRLSLKKLFWIFALISGAVNAAPIIELGEPENHCSVYCYIKVPFTIVNYGPGQRIGRVFCDFDAEITAALPVYGGEVKTKNMQVSPIGVFKSNAGTAKGVVEMDTGIAKNYFMGAKVKSVRCHL